MRRGGFFFAPITDLTKKDLTVILIL